MERQKHPEHTAEELKRDIEARAAQARERATQTREHLAERGHEQADTQSNRAHELVERAQARADQMAEEARDSIEQNREHAHGTVDRVRGQVDEAQQRTERRIDETRRNAEARVHETREQAYGRADEFMTRSGEQLEQVAHTIRKRAPDRDARRLSDQAAERFERSGRYLQQARPQDLRSDLETAIRAHPLRSMLIGLGIGMIIGRITGGKK